MLPPTSFRSESAAHSRVLIPDHGLRLSLIPGARAAGRPRRRRRAAGQHPRGLSGSAVGHVLARLGHHDRAPRMAGAIRRTASDRAPPPISSTRRTSTPDARNASSPSASPHSIPSTAARARFAGGGSSRRSCRAGRRWRPGRLGVRSPARYGRSVSPPAPGLRESASSPSRSRSTPSMAAVAVSTRGRVERADQRQVAPGRVGEAGHDPGRVDRRRLAYREHRSGSPD